MYDSGMRVLFVSPNTERLNIPVLPLGLALVAAAARRAGHQTRFLTCWAPRPPWQRSARRCRRPRSSWSRCGTWWPPAGPPAPPSSWWAGPANTYWSPRALWRSKHGGIAPSSRDPGGMLPGHLAFDGPRKRARRLRRSADRLGDTRVGSSSPRPAARLRWSTSAPTPTPTPTRRRIPATATTKARCAD